MRDLFVEKVCGDLIVDLYEVMVYNQQELCTPSLVLRGEFWLEPCQSARCVFRVIRYPRGAQHRD